MKLLLQSVLMCLLGTVCGAAIGFGESGIVLMICSIGGALFMLCLYLVALLLAQLLPFHGRRNIREDDFWDRSHRMYRIERTFLRDGKPW